MKLLSAALGLTLTACSVASGQALTANGADADPYYLINTFDETMQRTPMEEASRLLHPYVICVRDNGAAWARSTTERAEIVLEAAFASCLPVERDAKVKFIAMMEERIGLSPRSAAAAWDDEAEERRRFVRGVALTAILNARSRP